MADQRRARLDPAIFSLPVGRLRAGYYTDAYFTFSKQLLEHEDRHPRVLMQVFQKHDTLLGGIDEAIAVLRLAAGRAGPDGDWEEGWEQLEVRALCEGDRIAPWETVMTIEGDYSLFAHLETVYLGCLARRSLVMRNVRAVVDAAAGKQILFFPARHDHWLVQTGDGWAAHVAGAIGVSTDARPRGGAGADRHRAACPDRRLRRRHRRRREGVRAPLRRRGFDAEKIAAFERAGAPWTPTASARPCCGARTTSPPTWSRSRAIRRPRWAACCARTRASSSSTEPRRWDRLAAMRTRALTPRLETPAPPGPTPGPDPMPPNPGPGPTPRPPQPPDPSPPAI